MIDAREHVSPRYWSPFYAKESVFSLNEKQKVYSSMDVIYFLRNMCNIKEDLSDLVSWSDSASICWD